MPTLDKFRDELVEKLANNHISFENIWNKD
jgi:hypothetical protein